ncbi:solute carrier organic anion transporter family member 1A2 [Rhinatrema bivittatum]|uniref:solute carrier organic anion transporter family member 1A2 n=1 Tax=Rhinatrema bivittatum TaxID=194408 RepID=UPI00112E9FED|nr:solute carrier organic anion transporter family member 1A2 [Rhinatrema bivittatum]XP_029472410.1 solute carrier organic anion transporter family member 1A2 [Rhinatrema bivittatum]XP_029472411.1 solute carrier organic anion transporter family member 1A2 [Rhinatrema bivittatum]
MKETEKPQSAKKQCCISKLKIFLLALSFAYLSKGMAGSYSKSMITQIERRFNIPASLVGVIDGSFEIGNLLVIAFVSYFGAKLHRPRIIAIGCIVEALGCCLMALPHFLMGRYQYEKAISSANNSSSSISLCQANQNESFIPPEELSPECIEEAESLMWIYVLMGNILRGIGETPVAPLGLSYVDDFAKMENSPFYIGCIQTVAVLGPLFGSLLAAFCAKLYVDIGSINLENIMLSLIDARWVGAWWLGYLICGAVNFFAAIPFCFLPKSLPKEGQEDEKELSVETSKNLLRDTDKNQCQNSKQRITEDFLPFLRSLSHNSIYMLFLCITVLQFNAFVGMITFMPKYIEVQYGKSASEAIFLIGVYNLPVICIGYFLGGLYMKKFKVTTLQAANIGLVTSLVEYLIFFLAYSMVCTNSAVAGLTVSYEGHEQVFYLDALKSDCNLDCTCLTSTWDPVCGDNGISYVSACLAGCDSSTMTGQNTVFKNCSCILKAPASLYGNVSAVPGQCQREESCDTMLLYFLILSLLCCLMYSFGAIPGYMVLIRSLKPEEKSFGVGVHLLSFRALAGIPAPIYFGAMIDTTCIKWGTTSCGAPGACRMYDSDAYRSIYLGVIAALRAVSYIPCAFIIIILKRQPRHDDDKTSVNDRMEMTDKRKSNSINEDKCSKA